jgi:hypothetical protein
MKGVFKDQAVNKKSGDPVEATISVIDGIRPNIKTDDAGAFEVKVDAAATSPRPTP